MKATVLRILKNLAHPGTIIGIIASMAIPFLVYLAPNIGHKDIIQQLDLYLPFPLFAIQFIASIVLFVLLQKDFRNWIKTILPEKKFTILMVLFTLAVTIFAATQIEARHRVQSDESVFMSVAQNMYYNQESGTCNQGYFQDGGLNCVSKSNSFKTKGLSFLYTLGIPLLGTDLHWIFNFELLLLPLAVLLMFLAVVAWTRQPLLAFFAALLTALQPTVLFQFRSMSVEPLYIFLSALSVLTFRWAFDRNTLKHWVLFALILAFFAQTRQETVFCFAPFILVALPKLLNEKSFKAPAFFVTLSLFSVPVLLTISYFQGFGFQGGEFEAHGHFLEDVSKNWEVMTKPLNDKGELVNPFLTYFNYLFAIGGISLILKALFDAFTRKDKYRFFFLEFLIFLVLYHLQTYVILENVSGDFTIEINQRYSLVMLPTMAILGAIPVAYLILFSTKLISNPKTFTTVACVLGLLVGAGFTAWTFHYKEDFNKNVMYNRNHLTTEESEILRWLSTMPQKDRLFIYGRPWHFIGYGISSIHYDRARQMSSDELKNLVDKYQGEVYYIRGLDCWDSQTYHKKAVEHRIPTTCDVFEREMDMEGVTNMLITNNYWVQIAKFNGRRNYNPVNIIAVEEPTFVVPTDTLAGKPGLRIAFSLNERGNAINDWSYAVYVNGEKTGDGPYIRGSIQLNYSESKLNAGYSTIRYVVYDNLKRKSIADIQKYYFHNVNGATPLVNLSYESHQQGWGNFHKNESIDGNTMKIAGKQYAYGLGIHAPSTTIYNIDGKYKTFQASFGLDEESLCGDGARIQIAGDSKVLYESETFTAETLGSLNVNIEGVKKLMITTLQLESNNCDHVDIVNPVLIP
ncbi:NPCBM/NEW2 domain-containing protein [Fibrobacter sp. UWEL]|uniref:NPCBM/NEW2 domain-containing protein n=1 Tax=Fibrobacter sp. UWEL TaxID=1896209 RepID=UPI0009168770|nr:NPCBM/NEW2 domain-containing protein [Fibrobacter sp. UWEL]SHK57254.1 NPCBM/NEW2 domain-containing protein [Fibrobacter sp. UWEL]